MKKPRIEDFDPNSAPQLGSPLDDLPAIKPPARTETEVSQPTIPSLKHKRSEPRDLTVQKIERTKDYSNVRTNDRSNEPTYRNPALLRQKIRHTFDIFADQLFSLREIQLNREKVMGKKYRLGDLIQEALDMLITKERNIE